MERGASKVQFHYRPLESFEHLKTLCEVNAKNRENALPG